MVDKDEILQAIRFQAAGNGGVPLGKRRFESVTGIREASWSGKYWARWNDALVEAGFEPNVWNQQSHDADLLIERLADLTLELGHYPTAAERNMRHRQDPKFPFDSSYVTYLGTRPEQLRKLIEFGLAHSNYSELYGMCAPLLEEAPTTRTRGAQAASVPGRVYLIRSGTFYKIGKTDQPNRRYREIQLLVPGELEEVHVLETDDPAGIELYWHRRFAHRRTKGEWFELTASDVEAFKRRGKFM